MFFRKEFLCYIIIQRHAKSYNFNFQQLINLLKNTLSAFDTTVIRF